MIIYEVEIYIEKKMAKKWLKWMKSKHIPDIMKTGLFTQYKIFKNLNQEATYIIQYEAEKKEDYINYQKTFEKDLQKDHIKKFKGQFKANRRLLKTYKKI